MLIYAPLIAAVLITLAGLVLLFVRSESVAFFSVLAVFVVDSVYLGSPALEVGGFNVAAPDVISPVLLIAAVLRLIPQRWKSLHISLGVFVVAALPSLGFGLEFYGLKASVNEFRPFLSFIATTFYFSSLDFTPATIRRLKSAWCTAAVVLILVAFYRWSAWAFGLPVMDSWEALKGASDGRLPRALSAENALLLFQAWLLLGPSVTKKRLSRPAWAFAVLLFGLVILLQHRTVWIAAIACLVFLFGRIRTLIQRPLRLGTAVAGVCLALAAAMSGGSNPVVSSLRYSVLEPTEATHSTFEWRVSGWEALLGGSNAPNTLGDKLFGARPFGAGLRRRVDNAVVDVSAHNFYVDMFMKMGAAGLLALLSIYGLLCRKLWRMRLNGPPQVNHWRVVVAAIIISQVTYYFGYDAGYEQGILLGAAISFAAARIPAVSWRAAAARAAIHAFRLRQAPLTGRNPLAPQAAPYA